MKALYTLIPILLCVFTQRLSAQELMTVQDAVKLGLENNYDIKVSESNLLIAKENVTYGNAGMLPTATLNFSQTNSKQNTTQTQATGEVRSLDNAKNNSLSYGVSLGWTIFDGLGMFARYETLKELEKQGNLQLKSTILTRVSDIITTYYNIVEQQNLLNAIDSSILISKERLRTAENRFSIGKASRLEVLNVQVNLNSDESARLRQLDVVKNLKTTLNSLIAQPLNTDFAVVDEVVIDEDLKFADLMSRAKESNPDLLAVNLNKKIAELELKAVKANRYPVVRLNGGYNISGSESSLGFVAQSNSKGLNYGITASMNIFDGFNQRRNERIAKIRIDQSDLQYKNQLLQLETALSQAFQTYQTNIALSRLEQTNEQIARQNLNITLDKYKIGTLSAVEFRDAQENFINAISRMNAAKLQAKLSEAYLKELVGQVDLIK